MTIRRRYGFKGKEQLPLFMIWDEYWENGEVVYGRVIFNSHGKRRYMSTETKVSLWLILIAATFTVWIVIGINVAVENLMK